MKDNIIKFIKDKIMARPKVVQLEHGTVSLQGFPKEISDALVEYIKNFNQPVTLTPPSKLLESSLVESLVVEEDTPISLQDLPSRAIGVYSDGTDRRLVTVAYNLDTKEALVESDVKCEGMRDSSMKFKMAADKHKFV